MTEDNTIPEFRRVKDVVRQVLQAEVRARNDDKYLTWCVLNRMGFKVFMDFKTFNDMPSFETIRRARQRIQNNDGEYMPTDSLVKRKRAKRERIYSRIPEWDE